MDTRQDTAFPPAPDLAEKELVERYRATGDGRWFEELYRRTRRKVFGVCLRILGDATKAEDACHEAFVRSYERFDSLRGDNFSAWVCRIAANRSYDEVRRRPPEEPTKGEVDPIRRETAPGAEMPGDRRPRITTLRSLGVRAMERAATAGIDTPGGVPQVGNHW